LGRKATIELDSQLPTITDASGLTIDGQKKKITISGKDAVRVFEVGSGAKLVLARLTVADGSASLGGGIFNAGTVEVTNSTFSGNSASGSGGAILNEPGGTATLSNTIMANSPSGGNCVNEATLIDGGGNLDDGTTCGFTASTSKSMTPAGLDPADLKDNGGPTQTIALCSGVGTPTGCTGPSAAIDAAVSCPPPTTDQRGVSRPQGSACDIGSFELEEPENQAPTVTVDGGGSCGSASDMRGTINLALLDPDDPPESLTLTATSSDRSVLPNRNISFGGGTDASRTMTVTSLTGSGISNVTITVSDDGGLKGTVSVRVISGSASKNTLIGSADTDMIFARKGSDTLSAQGANDLMCGGNGNDKLTGGLGADRFVGGSGTDTATDFNAAQGDTKAGIP
jgi:RTX calcium-binding nonapeptide repeat (4 copies)